MKHVKLFESFLNEATDKIDTSFDGIINIVDSYLFSDPKKTDKI